MVLFYFSKTGFLCNFVDCPRIARETRMDGLKLKRLPVSASPGLGIKVCTTMTWWLNYKVLSVSPTVSCVCRYIYTRAGGKKTLYKLMLLSQETKYHIHYYLCGKFLFYHKLPVLVT